MKVLVTGSRDWTDSRVHIILRELTLFGSDTIIVHGDQYGVDKMAGIVGEALGFIVRPYPARWDELRNWAGPVRNQHMINVEHLPHEPIDLVLAFHENISESVGTSDMIRAAKLAGIPHRVVSE